VLDQDLGIGAINGVARLVQDDVEGTYNACCEADNQKNCSYKPWSSAFDVSSEPGLTAHGSPNLAKPNNLAK
jgi:hypothetical protein